MGNSLNAQRRALLQAAGLAAVAGVIGTSAGLRAAESWKRPGGPVPKGEWWSGGGPRGAPSSVQIVAAAEPGERLILSGRVVDRDERPQRDVTVYVYQTDALGLYYREGRRQAGPRLRGWARTDGQGGYEFATIRPAHYPGERIPQHIHMTVSSDTLNEWWLPDVRFEGDPFLTADEQARSLRDGQYGNVRRLEPHADGVLRCTHHVRI